jgi:hypothetical protein
MKQPRSPVLPSGSRMLESWNAVCLSYVEDNKKITDDVRKVNNEQFSSTMDRGLI